MNLVTLTQPASAAAEAYRTLRANLFFAALDAPLKTILVVSPDNAADAAIVVANLAVTLAQSERRVIVVDVNLREPVLQAIFEVPNNVGLSDMLASANEPRIVATKVPGLSILPTGATSANTADVLSSARMDGVLEKIAGMCDVVLLCAPPLSAYSDAAVIAAKAQGTLLAVRAGKTRRDNAQKAKDILARAHARLLGAVMLGAS